MRRNKPLAYLSFTASCFIFGTSYAAVSVALRNPNVNGALLVCIRMLFATLCAGIALLMNRSKSSLTKTLPFGKMILLGVTSQGLPHFLITIAQRTLSSATVTIAQPCVPLFSIIFGVCMMSGEQSCRGIVPSLIALIGTIMTFAPNFSVEGNLVDYLYLAAAIASFGFSSVFTKAYLANMNDFVLVFFQLLSSAVFTSALTIFRNVEHKDISFDTLKWAAILGFVYSFLSCFSYTYTIKAFGPVKAGYTNFGQIIIGVITGVVFLDEWKDYSKSDTIISVCGLLLLVISIFIGFLPKKEEFLP